MVDSQLNHDFSVMLAHHGLYNDYETRLNSPKQSNSRLFGDFLSGVVSFQLLDSDKAIPSGIVDIAVMLSQGGEVKSIPMEPLTEGRNLRNDL